MPNYLHLALNDFEYWDLRLRLFELQRQTISDDAAYDEVKRDLIEDLHNYLITQVEEEDPWS